MDWTERFDGLTAAQRLGVAAMLAEHVSPLVGSVPALDDGLRLIWLQIGGRTTTRQELMLALNAALDAVGEIESSTQAHASRAALAVLEAALHNSDALRESVDAALEAVGSIDGTARNEEVAWLEWAMEAAGSSPRPTRATFQHPHAPRCDWRSKISRADLPLFGSVG